MASNGREHQIQALLLIKDGTNEAKSNSSPLHLFTSCRGSHCSDLLANPDKEDTRFGLLPGQTSEPAGIPGSESREGLDGGAQTPSTRSSSSSWAESSFFTFRPLPFYVVTHSDDFATGQLILK